MNKSCACFRANQLIVRKAVTAPDSAPGEGQPGGTSVNDPRRPADRSDRLNGPAMAGKVDHKPLDR
jgi:hypothetical protein